MNEIDQRFWNKVNKAGPFHKQLGSKCWEWTGCTNHKGYGHLRINTVFHIAHRRSWGFVNGCIPKGMHICHKCDNPKCVNPDHLFAGTAKDNTQDAIKKGRLIYPPIYQGESHPRSKLTKLEVLKIRELFATGNYTQVELSVSFGVTCYAIHDIVRRRSWRHI